MYVQVRVHAYMHKPGSRAPSLVVYEKKRLRHCIYSLFSNLNRGSPHFFCGDTEGMGSISPAIWV